MYVLCFTSNTIKHILAVKYPNRGNPCWFFFSLYKSHGRFLIGYIHIYYNIYSEAMANFMRNWRRPSRVCLYVLSGVNFSVLFLCMSPSRTIICTFSNVFPPFDFNAHYKRSLSYFWYDNPQSSENTFLPKTNIRVIFQKPGFLTLSILTGTTVFLLSCRPESPTCSAQGASCLSNLAARLLVSSTSSFSSFSNLTFYMRIHL